jgi:hypothetical protein
MLCTRYSKLLSARALIAPSGALREWHTHTHTRTHKHTDTQCSVKMSKYQMLTLRWPWHTFGAAYWFVACTAPRERLRPCWQSFPCHIKFLYWAGLGETAFRNTHLSCASPLVNDFGLGDSPQCNVKESTLLHQLNWCVDITNWSQRTIDIRSNGNFNVKWTVNMNSLRHVLQNTFRILRTKLPWKFDICLTMHHWYK